MRVTVLNTAPQHTTLAIIVCSAYMVWHGVLIFDSLLYSCIHVTLCQHEHTNE
jgi:hypothetical protein